MRGPTKIEIYKVDAVNFLDRIYTRMCKRYTMAHESEVLGTVGTPVRELARALQGARFDLGATAASATLEAPHRPLPRTWRTLR